MKNERIITHFQSYTTAKGCVKDLTPHFSGRISIASVKSAEQPPETHEKMEMGAGDIIEDLSEIGGIALGTVADLIPGLGPVLSGGPIVGAIVGDVFGDYMVARRHLTPAQDAAGEEAPRNGAVYVAVEVANEEEAQLAERIIREHNEMPHRSAVTSQQANGAHTSVAVASTGMDTLSKHSISGVDVNPYEDRITADLPADGAFTATTSERALMDASPDFPRNDVPEGPSEPPCEEIPEVRLEPNGDDIPDGLPQPSGHAKRRIPYRDGYDLDPLPPLSPRGWIDPNIGLGDSELADPTIFAHFDINRDVRENRNE
jgi:hypothetical protein